MPQARAGGEVVIIATVQADAAFVASPAAHGRVQLRSYRGEDASAPLMLELDRPLAGLPMRFSLTGDARIVFAESPTALISATVFNHPGAELAVGDLISEQNYRVRRSTGNITVEVRVLEACDAPGAGGACVQ